MLEAYDRRQQSQPSQPTSLDAMTELSNLSLDVALHFSLQSWNLKQSAGKHNGPPLQASTSVPKSVKECMEAINSASSLTEIVNGLADFQIGERNTDSVAEIVTRYSSITGLHHRL